MLPDFWTLLIQLTAGIGLGAFLILVLVQERKRQKKQKLKQMKSFAQKAGMKFYPKMPELEELLVSFDLFPGMLEKFWISNILEAQSGELSVFLFEYQGVSEFSARSSCKQTVVLLESFRWNYAHFILKPRKSSELWKNIADTKEVHGIRDQEFQKNYRLISQSPTETAQIFSEELTREIQQRLCWHVEGVANYLILFEPDQFVPGNQLESFFEEVVAIYQALEPQKRFPKPGSH